MKNEIAAAGGTSVADGIEINVEFEFNVKAPTPEVEPAVVEPSLNPCVLNVPPLLIRVSWAGQDSDTVSGRGEG